MLKLKKKMDERVNARKGLQPPKPQPELPEHSGIKKSKTVISSMLKL